MQGRGLAIDEDLYVAERSWPSGVLHTEMRHQCNCGVTLSPLSAASGVGRSSIASQRVTSSCCCPVGSDLPLVRFRVPLLSPAIGVGQKPGGVGELVAFAVREDEEPLAPVGRADLRRREEACRKAVTQADQASGDLGKSDAQMMGDVLEEDERRLALADDARDVRPEVPWVRRAAHPAGDRKWLARIPRKDRVHAAAPLAAVEGSNLVPDRCTIQGRVLHPRHEHGRGEGFPLDVTHSAIPGAGDGKPEVEPARPGAEREAEQDVTPAARSASGGM